MEPHAMEIRVVASDRLDDRDREGIHALFGENYRDANHAYLDKSFAGLRHTALAEVDGALVGFAIGDAVRANMPRFDDPQAVALAGLSCIDPATRRRGLFTRLSLAAMSANGVIAAAPRFLFTGRMAHVLTYRHMANNATNAVPDAAAPLTDWHREVAVRIAELFQCEVDPENFVVRGPGAPIGYPRVDFDAPKELEALFAPVDRSRGDALLAMAWMPDAPAGW
ncbi:MAG: hypothetical protein AAGF92_02005 [Myxococcota bacterium]